MSDKTDESYESCNNNRYAPSFHWKDQGIYDHDTLIAQFVSDPEGKQSICLESVRLAPGGQPLILWTLSWRRGVKTSKLESFDVRHSGGDTLSLEFTASTPEPGFTSHTRIDLSYDPKSQGYRYETSTSLQVDRFPFYSWREIDSIPSNFIPNEFANILAGDSYAYWAPVDPVPKKWQAFVYQNAQGGWSWVPQHHLRTPDKYDIQYPAGRCLLGLVDAPVGNPCVELIERVPDTSRSDICWALNDIHLFAGTVGHTNRSPYRVRYALRQFTPEETAEILAKAKGHVYTAEEKEAYDMPRFDHVGKNDFTCDFETGYDLEKPDDNFRFWLPMGDIRYTAWVRGEGRGGSRCLKQDTPLPARVLWQVESTNAPVVTAGKRYRVSAWIKTRDLKGTACLEAWSFRCSVGSAHDSLPASPVRSDALSGTTDWQEVAVEVDVADGLRLGDEVRGKMFIGKVAVRLVHDGQGASWFDDVAIREIGAAPLSM